MEHLELTQTVIGCAMKVHRLLGSGSLESVYQNALAHELHLAGLTVERERRLEVRYQDVVGGQFIDDMVG